jgi:hypothetical protein
VSDAPVINPFKVGAVRDLGTASPPLYTGDLGLGLSLTGGKSWHHIVPEVAGGLGFITDFRSQADSGGYKFGTRFALNWGGGIRIVPGGNWQVRGDIKNRLYTIGYPEAYYIAPPGGTAVVGNTQAKSFWLNNPAFTFGLSRCSSCGCGAARDTGDHRWKMGEPMARDFENIDDLDDLSDDELRAAWCATPSGAQRARHRRPRRVRRRRTRDPRRTRRNGRER